MKKTNFEHLEKYLGTPEIRPLWEKKSEKLLSTFNILLGAMEKSGPFLEQDIAKITEALKVHGFYSDPFLQAVKAVHQDMMYRNPVMQLHRVWCAAREKTEKEYQCWYNGLTNEERWWVTDWEARLLNAKEMRLHRAQQLATYGPDESPLDKIFHSLADDPNKDF